MSDLIEAARQARENAHAPYSHYKVGAAIRTPAGRIWGGCNVENTSYPMSMCAERNAVAAMVLGGENQIDEIAVATRDGGTPCGGCLQVLLEFSHDPAETVVRLIAEDGAAAEYKLIELIPHGFRST